MPGYRPLLLWRWRSGGCGTLVRRAHPTSSFKGCAASRPGIRAPRWRWLPRSRASRCVLRTRRWRRESEQSHSGNERQGLHRLGHSRAGRRYSQCGCQSAGECYPQPALSSQRYRDLNRHQHFLNRENMKKRFTSVLQLTTRVLLVTFLLLVHGVPVLNQTTNRSQSLIVDVDPFVGTENGGNIVPGAQLPFGFVHASPDTVNPNTAGYNPYENILGFSQTHVSGTGGASKYGNFLTTPLVGKLRVNNLGSPKEEEAASPGYYTVRLTRSGVKAELTATRLVGMHRYTYPASKLSHVLIDASSVVQPESGNDAIKNPHPVDCWVRIIAPNRIEGSGNFIGGWNQSPYTIHFAAEFDRPFNAFGTWRDSRIEPGTVAAANEGKVGAYATFDTTSNQTVQMKIGVSFISPDKAYANLLQEISGWDFDAVRRKSEAAWENVLGQIKIEGGSDEQHKIFYTALYHSH